MGHATTGLRCFPRATASSSGLRLKTFSQTFAWTDSAPTQLLLVPFQMSKRLPRRRRCLLPSTRRTLVYPVCSCSSPMCGPKDLSHLYHDDELRRVKRPLRPLHPAVHVSVERAFESMKKMEDNRTSNGRGRHGAFNGCGSGARWLGRNGQKRACGRVNEGDSNRRRVRWLCL